MFYKPCNRVGHGHCGLVIYIHNQFNATDITDTVTVEHTAWDYMCLEISHQKPNSKKYLISNMCVGATKGTYRRDIKMIVNHDYIKRCIIFAKKFFG